MERIGLNARLRRLPSVDEVLRSEAVVALLGRAPRWAVVQAVRGEVGRLRERIARSEAAAPGAPPPSREDVSRDGATAAAADGAAAIEPAAIERRVGELLRPSLVPVLNATGVVLHTNLGRAPLAEAALDAIVEAARGYTNLEYDLEKGERGSRHHHVAELVRALTGAEAALVVNNNAAAVLLALAGAAAGREVVVSRGELVEIGGAFRVPEVMAASGAKLVEVGTTNRTHPADYERAIGSATAALLKVHRSNFAVVGFTAEVGVRDLSALAHARGLPLLVDLGSGCFLELGRHGVPGEPTVRETVAAGADLVTFSGDKLLGGPQAGVLAGTEKRIGALREHPLLRALRPDKLTLAALGATLALYRDGREDEVPAVAMLLAPLPVLRARAARLAELLRGEAPGASIETLEVRSAVGGGALPLWEPLSCAVALAGGQCSPADLESALRAQSPPLVGRIAEGRLLLDVRTLRDADLPEVARVTGVALASLTSSQGEP